MNIKILNILNFIRNDIREMLLDSNDKISGTSYISRHCVFWFVFLFWYVCNICFFDSVNIFIKFIPELQNRNIETDNIYSVALSILNGFIYGYPLAILGGMAISYMNITLSRLRGLALSSYWYWLLILKNILIFSLYLSEVISMNISIIIYFILTIPVIAILTISKRLL